jgi:hypothetical protein
MKDEFDALLQNNTWTLVLKPSGANVVSGKWVFFVTNTIPMVHLLVTRLVGCAGFFSTTWDRF